jgi:hypothetical protein
VGSGVERRSWTRKQRQVALLATVLLILAASLCMVHGASDEPQGHTHGMTLDLCASVVMILAIPLLLVRPIMNGWVVSVLLPYLYAVPIEILDRPPEAVPLS